jgi:glycerol-3-phosphate acyltransferase PlsX
MGSACAQALGQIERPTVALLNIGTEEIKGNDLVKAAAELIHRDPDINYVGYIEGNAIFHGIVDVVVCDGFVGNSVLKASEGIAGMMMKLLKQFFTANLTSKIRGVIAKPVLKAMYQVLDPERYNGSSLLGLTETVVKSHGSASPRSFGFAIQQAKLAVEQDLPKKIGQNLKQLATPA